MLSKIDLIENRQKWAKKPSKPQKMAQKVDNQAKNARLWQTFTKLKQKN